MLTERTMIALPDPPRICAYAEREAFWANWGRNPALIYGCPSGRWVNHPNSGKLIRYDLMTPHWRERYDAKAGGKSTRLALMSDIDPFVSPIDGSVVGGRAQKRDHMARHDAVEAGDFQFDPHADASGYVEPTEREMEEEIYTASQMLEQGYWRDDPNRGYGDGFADIWTDQNALQRDRNLRTGGYA